jgi:hypothetical protein
LTKSPRVSAVPSIFIRAIRAIRGFSFGAHFIGQESTTDGTDVTDFLISRQKTSVATILTQENLIDEIAIQKNLPNNTIVRTGRIIQFGLAALLFSGGCLAMFKANFPFVTICFALPSLVLMRGSELTHPVSRRELWTGAIVIACFVTAITLAAIFNPHPHSDPPRFFSYPIFVVPLWLLGLLALFWRWRRETKWVASSKPLSC